MLLTHDLLLSKTGVAANANHVLKLAILRHKARLSAEFTKARIRRGHATLDALKESVENGELEENDEPTKKTYRHPRWVRVNTLQTTLSEQLNTTFSGYTKTNDIGDVQRASASAKVYFQDPNIPNLLAFPPKIDISKLPAYVKGAIIIQDKASCFPAYLLDVQSDDGDAIDGCAAPGNKTTHLAAIMSEGGANSQKRKVFAYEKDKIRAVTLQKMVKRASADSIVTVKASADFLRANPDSDEFANVGAILLDPSCSGSGIVGRDDAIKMHLPTQPEGTSNAAAGKKDKKRKRGPDSNKPEDSSTTLTLGLDDTTPEETPIEGQLSERLVALSTFQLRILTHAMRFPKARKITYSTCSVHFEENEGVVFQALASAIAKEQGWRILKREEQVEGLKIWDRRGVWEDGKMDSEVEVDNDSKDEVCKACIRCEKGTQEGTMGFFVAAFVRDVKRVGNSAAVSNDIDQDQEDEWNGFSDEEHSRTVDGKSRTDVNEATRAEPVASRTSKQPPKKKRKKGRSN